MLAGALGTLPTIVVYRLPTVGRAIVVAAVTGAAGEVAWGAHRAFVPAHVTQVVAFAAAGFLATLLVLGVLGGTRSGYKARHLKMLGVGARNGG
jgi:hypothetical protein